jgi:ceramide glucosyltransferase
MFLKAGWNIGTSFEVVENRNIDCTIKRTLERHTRWAKMRRAILPGAFLLEPLLSPILIATITAIGLRSREAALTLLLTIVFQTVLAHAALRLLRGHALKWYWAPLEILRSYLLFFCWARACFSRRIKWRGHPFLVMRDSVIVPAPPSSWSRLRAAARV